MQVTNLKPFPPKENPFHHDLYNMGTPFGTNVIVMYDTFNDVPMKSLIVVDMTTGERIQIDFADPKQEVIDYRDLESAKAVEFWTRTLQEDKNCW